MRTDSLLRCLTLLLLVPALAGAQSNSRPGTAAPPSAAAESAAAITPAPNPLSADYIVGAGDRLRITVWNQDNVSGEYTVGGDGSFTFPLIGRITASGLKLAALEATLRDRLADGFFNNPQVSVSVLEYRSKRVFLMGALRMPGTYPLTGDMTVIEALARAGSTTPDAADHAFIIRSSAAAGPVLPGQDAGAEMTRVDLGRLSEGQPSSNALVHDGDTVFVPRASTIFVYGQVRRPGAYPIGQNTTVRQALALAGGASEFGAVNRVKILRVVDGKEQEIRVKLNDEVEAGDTIVIPERFF